MNAIEIEEAVSELFAQDFDPENFPYQFLESYGNKSTTIKRLQSGNLNRSDVHNGVLQYNNIHIAVAPKDHVKAKLDELRNSIATKKQKAKYILATDGEWLEAEAVIDDTSTVACNYNEFPDQFGYFLPLAGISTVRQISENSFDIRATSRLNKLYVELLRINPDWSSTDRRQEMNHFMARLVFCFFAEDTGIFKSLNHMGNYRNRNETSMFTNTVDELSDRDGSNTHKVIEQIFKVMDVEFDERESSNLPRWTKGFPYVNGQLFSGKTEVPMFNKISRSYLIHIGNLDWTKVNPDIFGSMIQAVADDEERGALGMHYTSVPSILKVLNPLVLDDLRYQLDQAKESTQKLLNLRKRMANMRVFDPACGSGNFLVIAYKEMRQIEATINKLRNEPDRRTDIRLTNFRGIEIRHFSAEIARLALIIAEYQCDVMYRGQQEALADLLPLSSENWITCGNALREDWFKVCPPHKLEINKRDNLYGNKFQTNDLKSSEEKVEIIICGNPPYKGRNKKEDSEREDTEFVMSKYKGSFASLDFVANWFVKASEYCRDTGAKAAFVATNSICQGEQVALLWRIIFANDLRISFAHTSFKWSNLATANAGVTVIIVGLTTQNGDALLYTGSEVRKVKEIGPYLVPNSNVIVEKFHKPISDVDEMFLGNMAKDGGNLIMSIAEGRALVDHHGVDSHFVKKFFGSEELIHSKPRACLWIDESENDAAIKNPEIARRIELVRRFRLESKAVSTQKHAITPYKFVQISAKNGNRAIVIPRVSSENRPYLPVDIFQEGPIIGDKCFAIYDSELWNLALVASKMHIVWIGTVCSRLRTDYSYGNKLGWNTFPIPKLTESNRKELSQRAEDILLARETHFPDTIAELYDPSKMPENLRHAHERNDEAIERIYIGRRFRNDTERLEKLFELYSKLISELQSNTRKVI